MYIYIHSFVQLNYMTHKISISYTAIILKKTYCTIYIYTVYIYVHTLIFGGFLKWGYPQIIQTWTVLVLKPRVLGIPHFRKKPPFCTVSVVIYSSLFRCHTLNFISRWHLDASMSRQRVETRRMSTTSCGPWWELDQEQRNACFKATKLQWSLGHEKLVYTHSKEDLTIMGKESIKTVR